MPLRETTFIARNVENWERLELELERPHPDPDLVRDLYAGISDDLSYARTHYPNRSVRSYLNHKAATLSLSLYRNKRSGTGIAKFWMRTVPLEMYAQRIPLLLALIIFAICFVIGWVSGVDDPDFFGQVVGMGYVEQTRENIANGDPMAVYKNGSALGGALGIAGNNLQVSMLCFVTGILAGIGTLLVLVHNAIMVGAFQQFFFGEGVGWESVMGIWTHGTIEISSIVVAAGAGFTLAKGILWPGTLSRSRAFQLTALSGLRILAGIVPLIILAAIIEGFLTRLTQIPTPLRIMFLLVNLAFVLYYFILRPWQVGSQEARDTEDFGKLPPDRPLSWKEHEVLGPVEVFFDTLRYVFTQGGSAVLTLATAALILSTAWFAFHEAGAMSAYYMDYNPLGIDISVLTEGFTSWSTHVLVVVVLVVMPYLTYRVHQRLPGGVAGEALPVGIALAIPWALLALATWVHPFVGYLMLPLLVLWMRGVSHAGGNVMKGLVESIRFSARKFGYVFLLIIELAVCERLLALFFSTVWSGLVLPFIATNMPPALSAIFPAASTLSLASDLLYLGLALLLWIVGFGLMYHSIREYYLAEGLRLKVDKLLPV